MNRIATLILALALAACASNAPRERAPAPAPAAAPAPAPVFAVSADPYDQLYALAWMQTALEWAAVCEQTYASASRALALMIEQKAHGAEANALVPSERVRDAADEPLAVIVDVDETVLDNTPYQARLVRDGTVYAEDTWEAWSNERRARALPGAVAFAKFAAANGVTVFYVTNRKAVLREATIDNLRSEGFPLPADAATVLTRDDARGWTREKGSRRSEIDRTHRVVLLIGDNLGDFVDGASAQAAARIALVEPHRAWWGERWFMLPNPAYGSWVDAIMKTCSDQADVRACMAGALRAQ